MAYDLKVANTSPAPEESLLEMSSAPDSGGAVAMPAIDVCICTYRRQSLALTLASVLGQRGVTGPVRVIVADNDDTPSARGLVEAAARDGLDVLYVHAPARNISIARNACLDASTAPVLAFIDDDEIAHENWLGELLVALDDGGGRAAVFGPVRAVYPADAPTWAREADLHSTRPVETGRGVDTGYTSNALVRRASLGAARFDEALGRSGGEDTDLFTRLYADGARFGAAPAALVFEDVAASRLSTRWLAARAFRSGQTHARRFLSSMVTRVTAGVSALAKCAFCLILTVVNAGSGSGWRKAWVRASLHAGVVARLCGIREGRLYG